MRSIRSDAATRPWAGIGAMLIVVQLAWGAEDAGTRALQQHQLQRQQQEEAAQLRQLQQQRAVQSPPASAQERQALEKLHIDQKRRQQELHYRQSIEPPAVQPADDEGTRRAKAEMERLKAQKQSEQQIRQFEKELQQESGK